MFHTPTERVAAGAKMLDERVPDWRSRINTDFLNIADDTRCIAGQLFGSYVAARKTTFELTFDEAITLGFYVPGDQSAQDVRREYNMLTAAWRDEILSPRLEMAA